MRIYEPSVIVVTERKSWIPDAATVSRPSLILLIEVGPQNFGAIRKALAGGSETEHFVAPQVAAQVLGQAFFAWLMTAAGIYDRISAPMGQIHNLIENETSLGGSENFPVPWPPRLGKSRAAIRCYLARMVFGKPAVDYRHFDGKLTSGERATNAKRTV
jgi:hypothetical protein